MPDGVTGNMYTWYFLNSQSGTETNPMEHVSTLYCLRTLILLILSRQFDLELSFYKLVLDFSTPDIFHLDLQVPNANLLLGALFHTNFSLLLL